MTFSNDPYQPLEVLFVSSHLLSPYYLIVLRVWKCWPMPMAVVQWTQHTSEMTCAEKNRQESCISSQKLGEDVRIISQTAERAGGQIGKGCWPPALSWEMRQEVAVGLLYQLVFVCHQLVTLHFSFPMHPILILRWTQLCADHVRTDL